MEAMIGESTDMFLIVDMDGEGRWKVKDNSCVSSWSDSGWQMRRDTQEKVSNRQLCVQIWSSEERTGLKM